MMRVKDVGAREMVLEHVLFKIIFLHIQGLHCREGIFDLEDHVGQEALSSNLLPKIRFVKKFLLQVFLIIC
jgi:hypothetical protein